MERRDSPRYEIQVPLTFSGQSIAGSGLMTSLSKEGCHVVSEDSLPARACLSLHVEFPAPYEPLTVEVAEVRWTDATGFGLVFVHVHDEEHARLQKFIDWLKRTQNN
ncbi:MAG TPA: PilZ domain-containing protein [Nitrospira sp.]|nr:PilZ domain-containing protein [Nitrospira sp.]MCC7471341.1 PilZ domain-containing protein [Candidatus Nomurabacteria bacterium]MBS0158923.1 PilZ domain-containing protein [Nitrospira sp.]MBS0161113.1 PilZ domain-containing protein [Nitrospira sp.]MBS0176817.1 PilZ domain-containing protein [Nitrospira sp.]